MEVSIIIPTCNRLKQLKLCVESLLSQDFPAQTAEIIIVDDRADKTVEAMINSFKAAKFSLRYFSQEAKGPAAARNLGIEKSQANIVAFIDDDCLAEKSWLRLMFDAHTSKPGCAAVGGMTVLGYDQIAAEIGQFLSTCSIQTQINQKLETIFFPTCNVSIKKEIFNNIAFNEKFPLPGGEDLEFFWRLYKTGASLYWDKKIIVLHNRDKSIGSFVRQAYNYGRGNYYVQYIHCDHPLLKEIKTGRLSFWLASAINILKIPRFSYTLGKKMLEEKQKVSLADRMKTYFLYALHKIIYIIGNIVEHCRLLPCGATAQNTSALQVQAPQLLILDITHACNLHCRICDIWKTHKDEKDLDLEVIKKLLTEAKQLEIKEIALSGGEPLLRADILEILEHAKNLGIKNLGILTNGIEMEKQFNIIKPYLLDKTISPVISLDSLKPEIHNYIRNDKNAWRKTMQGIKVLLELKQHHRQVEVNIISIVLNQNLEELLPLAEHLHSIGVSSLQFQGLLANNLNLAQRKQSEFWIQAEQLSLLDQTLEGLVSFKEAKGNFIKNSRSNLLLLKKYFRGQLEKSDVICMSAEKTFLVSNQGMCTTCFLPYGNVRRQHLKNIMEDKQIIAARKAVKLCSWPCLLPCFCDK